MARNSLILAALGLLVGCDVLGPSTGLQEIRIEGDDQSTFIEGEIQLSATGFDSDGQRVELTELAWTSSDGAVASVDGTGLVLGRKRGATKITARSGGVEGHFEVRVEGTVHTPGVIQSVQTWTAADGPHIVKGEIWLAAALTIEAGAEVRFDQGALINGHAQPLRVQGTAAAPVRLIAHEPDPQPGHWGGLVVGQDAEITHAELTHCGASSAGNACIRGVEDVLIQHVEVTQSGGDGVYLLSGFAPGSDDLTVRGSAGYPLALVASKVNSIPSSITLEANGRQAVLLNGADVGTETWRLLEVPYHVSGVVAVAEGQTLTLPAGADLRWVDGGNLLVLGTLLAMGTVDDPIRLTSARETPEPGDWGGVVFDSDLEDSVLEYVELSYCGPRMGGCVSLQAPRSQLLRNVSVDASGWWGLVMHGGFAPGSENIRISRTAENPINIHATRLGTIPESLDMWELGVASILVESGTIGSRVTWLDRGLPYDIAGGPIDVYGDSAELVIAPGLVLRFGSESEGGIGVHAGATLIAEGTAAAPITFTTSAESPQPGTWGGLDITTGASTRTRLDHVILEYGGGAGLYWSVPAMIMVRREIGAFITNAVIRGSNSCGIYREGEITTDFSDPAHGNIFADNRYADQC